MSGQYRNKLYQGLTVDIVLKQNQRTGILTRGEIAEILTKSQFHPHGIKVKLFSGQIGRVKVIVSNDPSHKSKE